MKLPSIRIFLVAFILDFSSIANAQESVPLWECKAIGENVGKSEPNYTSDLMRWPDDRLRTIEQNADYYTSDNPENEEIEWLEIFAIPAGHGNTLIGFLKKENFECTLYQG